MGNIYKHQTALKFILDTGIDLTSVTDQKVKYMKPSGTLGEWSASIEGNATGGKISYTVSATGDVNESGTWTFWSYVEMLSGNAPGEAYELHVYDEGE